MNPKRISAKLFVEPEPSAPVDLDPWIPLFHRFIQEKTVPGLLIDVADYAHVPDGPGVLLIGHEIDYNLDLTDGRAGLMVTRKHFGDEPLGAVLRDALLSALIAAEAVHRDGTTGLRFGTSSAEIRILDRLVGPNTDDGYATLLEAAGATLHEVFGSDCTPSRVWADDARRPLTVGVTAPAAGEVAAVIERLGGTLPEVTRWEISVEELKKLRDEDAPLRLIDVRDADEYETCNLGGELIPLSDLSDKLGDLDAAERVVVHCKTGDRGARAVRLLRDAGFVDASNVAGGILAWIDRIDPSLTRY